MTTLHAKLMCSSCGRWTLHLFHERRAQRKGPGPAPRGPQFLDLVYACDVCETMRVWGNERKPPSFKQADDHEAALEHAVDVHGWRTVDCPACHGVGLDCSECGDRGEIWVWDSIDPCGPDCLLERLGRR
jgi:hypothetical protein